MARRLRQTNTGTFHFAPVPPLKSKGTMKMVFRVNQRELQKEMTEYFSGLILRSLNRSRLTIVPAMRKLIADLIKESPTYESLMSGQLYGDIGVPDIRQRMDRIIDIWTNGFDVEVKSPRTRDGALQGQINIKFFRRGWTDVINAPAAIFLVNNRQNSQLRWLEWLLKEGDRTIVRGYDIAIDPERSRTGLKVMKRNPRQSFGIRHQHQGTNTDNFVLRAMENLDERMEPIFMKSIMRSINAFN